MIFMDKTYSSDKSQNPHDVLLSFWHTCTALSQHKWNYKVRCLFILISSSASFISLFCSDLIDLNNGEKGKKPQQYMHAWLHFLYWNYSRDEFRHKLFSLVVQEVGILSNIDPKIFNLQATAHHSSTVDGYVTFTKS